MMRICTDPVWTGRVPPECMHHVPQMMDSAVLHFLHICGSYAHGGVPVLMDSKLILFYFD